MTDARRVARSVGLILVANIVGVACNYGFQLRSARGLSPADFAALFGWLTQFGTFVFFSTLAQNYAQVHLTKRFSLLRLTVLAFTALTAAAVVFGPSFSPNAMLAWATLLNVGLGVLVGQVMGRSAFVLVALASTSSFAVRFGWFLLGSVELGRGYKATVLGLCVNAALLALWPITEKEHRSPPGTTGALLRASGLAAVIVIVPNIDWILLDGVTAPGELAEASVALLFTRFVTVVGITVLNVTLTARSRSAENGTELSPLVKNGERLTIGAVLFGAPIAALIVPWMAEHVLRTAAVPKFALVCVLMVHHAAWLSAAALYQAALLQKRTLGPAVILIVAALVELSTRFVTLPAHERIALAAVVSWLAVAGVRVQGQISKTSK